MKFSIKKLRAAFSDTKTNEALEADTYTEDIINDVEGAPFALSETNVLYAGLSELAGYHYFKTIIIGTFQLKTFKGATLIVNGTDFKLELKSDMEELESESTNGSNRHLTRIDFEIDKDAISKISRTTVENMELIAKKNHILFSIIEGGYDEGLTTEGLIDEGLDKDTPVEDA
ncbi:hypothetical protein [Gelidibacter salicanalis]|uniref:Uncharacterized protein n=1 Tax=Gelidibacter salicanalis TaxID=291193 RepID=A0A934NKH0_9FLAO|nr:hypothetical protein [Gelidibacter salicanalis]MBJ7880547.1 hypothetical protein [Gelidibacter salicanalis]